MSVERSSQYIGSLEQIDALSASLIVELVPTVMQVLKPRLARKVLREMAARASLPALFGPVPMGIRELPPATPISNHSSTSVWTAN